MICFLDKTFCASDCTNTDCHRHFGDAERQRAHEWWGDLPGKPPVAFSDFSDTCPAYLAPAVAQKDTNWETEN